MDSEISRLTSIMLKKLQEKGIIQFALEENGINYYRFPKENDFSSNSNSPSNVEIRRLYEFKEVVERIISHPTVAKDLLNKLPQTFCEKLDYLISRNYLEIDWANEPLIRNLLDQTQDILDDESTRKTALDAIRKNGVSFNLAVHSLLTNFCRICLQIILQDSGLKFNLNSVSNEMENVANFQVRFTECNVSVIISVKLRKGMTSTKEFVDEGVSYLSRTSSEDSYFSYVFFLYTFEGQETLTRLSFDFTANRRGLTSMEDRIFVVPISIQLLGNFQAEFNSTWQKAFGIRKSIFIFESQRNQLPKRVDDHFFERPIDLGESDLLIRFRTSNSDYWRFGFLFSNTKEQPDLDERHPVKKTLVHLGKEQGKGLVSWAHYKSANPFDKGETKLTSYDGQWITAKITSTPADTFVRFLDNNNYPIITQPVSVGGLRFCWIFAWADRVNPFSFETEIFEIRRR